MATEYSRHLTGSGEFTSDFSFPGELYGYVLRSPHAHAVIVSVDVAPALAMDGVLAVFTGADLSSAGIGTFPCHWPVEQPDGTPMASPPNPVLAIERVRHVGEAVAFIVAQDRCTAVDAADAIEVDYKVLPSVTDLHAATAPDAPQIWPEAPNNIVYRCEFGDRNATEAAFRRADRIVRRHIVFPRIIVNTIEGRAAIAVPEGHSCTLYTPSQGAQFLRSLLTPVLGCEEEELHVRTPDVGGAFGMKCFPYPEQVLVIHAARVLNRPVKWVGERSSDGFLSDNQARDQSFDIKLALDGNGRFLGIRMHTIANLGAYLSLYGPLNSTNVSRLPGPYDIPAGYVEVTGVFTNTVQVDAYRGAARAELVYPLERIVDAAARETGIDPAEIRRSNFAQPNGPTRRNCFGLELASRDHCASLETALARAGWSEWPERRAEARQRDRCAGIGLASYFVSGMGEAEKARLTVDSDGLVSIFFGTQSSGQGHATVFSEIVADELSIDPDRVRLFQGDTRLFASNSITGGSRSARAGAPTCRAAAQAWLTRGREVASTLMQTEIDEVFYEAGAFCSKATGAVLDLRNLVRAAAEAGLAVAGPEQSLSVEVDHDPGSSNWPCGTHICEVEIDPETGAFRLTRYVSVDDIGHVLAPSLAVGQVHGGVTQGLGQALLEKCSYDDASGQLLSGSLMDYALPRADHVPIFETHFDGNQKSAGMHGLGEMGTIASMPAIMNALADALSGVGANEIDAPGTPERIWRACNAGP